MLLLLLLLVAPVLDKDDNNIRNFVVIWSNIGANGNINISASVNYSVDVIGKCLGTIVERITLLLQKGPNQAICTTKAAAVSVIVQTNRQSQRLS
jgi:hypothetical protein